MTLFPNPEDVTVSGEICTVESLDNPIAAVTLSKKCQKIRAVLQQRKTEPKSLPCSALKCLLSALVSRSKDRSRPKTSKHVKEDIWQGGHVHMTSDLFWEGRGGGKGPKKAGKMTCCPSRQKGEVKKPRKYRSILPI